MPISLLISSLQKLCRSRDEKPSSGLDIDTWLRAESSETVTQYINVVNNIFVSVGFQED